ncbi:hypothetical protein F8S13_16420 [Chloroflexia bacterium SDU3-3]|nr:hypothetical protein F8S13_16420 [Chloroflexia bacterium SDU3-3]
MVRYSWWKQALAAALIFAIVCALAPAMVLWGARNVIPALLPIVAAAALLLLPGMALLELLWFGPLAPAERWVLAVGVSCSAIPLLLLGSSLVGLRWGAALAWALLALCAGVVAWGWWRRRGHARAGLALSPSHVALLGITALALLLRLYVSRDLPVAMFGDSYHHTIITQLLIDHGGLFSSWQPYAPLKTFTYHYGFHSLAAFLSMLGGIPATASVIAVGQVESALAAPMVYLLTRRLLRHEGAALFGALLTVFVSTMPAYYVNWGRYTQLGGQTELVAIMVAWMWLVDATLDQPQLGWGQRVRLVALAALTTAGIVVTHYRIAVFAVCFVPLYVCYALSAAWLHERGAGYTWRAWLARLLPLVWAGAAACAAVVLATLPWLIRLREGALLRIGGYYLSTAVSADAGVGDAFGLYLAPWLAALAAAGLGLCLWRRQWRALLLAGWLVLTWLAANPYLLHLPGTGLITSFTVLIGLYLFLMPLAGAALAYGAELALGLLRVRAPLLRAGLPALLGVALIGWGLPWQQQILAPQNQLVFPADMQAMDWIRQEIPADAQIFVNSFPSYGGGVYTGSDGGWWITFLAGRTTNVQPAPYGTEAGERPDFQFWVQGVNETIMAHSLEQPEAVQALKRAGFSYLYDGPGNTSPGGAEYIRPDVVDGLPDLYEKVYAKGGVTIWRIR